jgi:hypothetical protein
MDRTEEILNLIRGLRVQLDSVSSRVEEMDDDIPETGGRGIIEDAGSSYWSGVAVDFYGATLITVDLTDPETILGKYFCYHTGLSPTKHADGTWPKGLTAGAWSWCQTVKGSPWMSWEVGGVEIKDESGDSYTPKRYALISGKTVGDIRITVPIPSSAYQVIQLGAGTGTSTTDNGVLANYTRAH